MMNNPLVVEQARNIVRRADFKTRSGPEARVELLYKLIYQRNPTEVELKLALEYLRSDAAAEWQTNAQAAWEYGYGTFDSATGHVRFFAPMGNFANRAWQPGGKVTDPRLKTLSLTAEGETTANEFGVIRRWVFARRNRKLAKSLQV